MKQTKIYMISDTGAVSFITNYKEKKLIKRLEKDGFHICSKEEFAKKRIQQQKEDRESFRKSMTNKGWFIF